VTAYEHGADRIPPPPRPIELGDADTRGWWHPVLLGVLLVGLGVWMLTNLYESVVVLAWLAGASLIVAGAAEVVVLGGREALGWMAWIGGAVAIVAGLILLAWPDATLRVVAMVVGLAFVIEGGLSLITALATREEPGWVFDLGLGGLAVATGAVILAWPEATLLVLAVVFGIRAIGTGLVAIGLGWQLRQLGR
jgi:uncharacterized membrane protein HdeD (DUF308 family)